MKKILLLLTTLTMFACSNDEQLSFQQKSELVVRPLVQNATRGDAVTLSNLTDFRVWGVNADDANPAIEKNFMDVASVSLDGSTWSMEDVHYWMTDPVSGIPNYGANEVKLTGFHPKELVTDSVLPTTKELNISSANGRNHQDIIISHYVATRNNNLGNGVPMNFKHALSQIVVRAQNGHIAERKIEIIGVKLCTVKPKGTLIFPTTTTSTSTVYNPVVDPSGDAVSYIIKRQDSNVVTLTEDAQNIMFDGENPGGFMIIPQSFTCNPVQAYLAATDTYLSVLCRIYKKDNDSGQWLLIYPKGTDTGKYAFAATGISGKWEPGKKYIYTLKFYEDNGGAGVIDPTPTDPDDPDNPEVDTTPDDPSNPTGAVDDEQAKTPITFTVTVEDWLNGSGSSSDFQKIM